MDRTLVDWIWTVRGSLALAPGQSGADAFDRLDPLFLQSGTRHQRSGDTLVFDKRDQAAQDKMSVFDGGELRIERGAGGTVLRYRLTSRILLFCFLAPLLFLALGQVTVALGKLQTPPTAAEKAAAEKKAAAKKPPPINPVDKLLGAPEPEKPKTGKDKEKDKEEDETPSPTAAYVFAGIFAMLYLVGRILEDRLVMRLFRRRLSDAAAGGPAFA